MDQTYPVYITLLVIIRKKTCLCDNENFLKLILLKNNGRLHSGSAMEVIREERKESGEAVLPTRTKAYRKVGNILHTPNDNWPLNRAHGVGSCPKQKAEHRPLSTNRSELRGERSMPM